MAPSKPRSRRGALANPSPDQNAVSQAYGRTKRAQATPRSNAALLAAHVRTLREAGPDLSPAREVVAPIGGITAGAPCGSERQVC